MTQLDPRRYLRLTKQIYAGRDDGLFFDTQSLRLVAVYNNTVYEAPLQLSSQDTGDIIQRGASAWAAADVATLLAGGTQSQLAKPRLRVIEETLTAASLTDGGSTVGTKVLTASIPAGAVVLRTTATGLTGFAGNVSATLTLGDGTDADRYNTGTPSVFTTAANGIDLGAPSGTAFHATAANITATVTSSSDITPVLAGGGSVDLKFWILEPI